MRIRFNKIDGFVRVYDGSKYLALFGLEKNDAICNRIRYVIGAKKGFIYISFHNYARIKFKTLTFHSIIKNLAQFLIKIKITTTIIYF